MRTRIAFIIMAVFAILIGLYPVTYFIIDRTFGLLKSKSTFLLNSVLWNIAFYMHIIFGGAALLIGWVQFDSRLRKQRRTLHNLVRKIYVFSVLLSSFSGIYISFSATGGIIASAGFISLGSIWFYTTLRAYIEIKNKRFDRHSEMMIYSYSACLAAVTLRLWLPILVLLFQNFMTAYLVVAWLSWLPNLIAAFFIIKAVRKNKDKIAPETSSLLRAIV
ncbi:MAG: DUF2306 domain-containing protein [Flavisolibacter sp.]|nr:DUF2306 domain-containing protein [Flavisolibacter sp.]